MPLMRFISILIQLLQVLASANVLELPHLRAAPGSTFKVAVFADLHFGENAWTDWGPQQDLSSIGVMSTVLQNEIPDFVVYLGDVITGDNIPIANASMYWDLATAPARERGIPWATIFGNHDDAQFVWPVEWFSANGIPPVDCSSASSLFRGNKACGFTGTTRVELMKHEIGSNTQSLSRPGPVNLWPSVSNYVLQVCSHDDPQSPVAFLYFLDSGGGSYPEVISKAQVEWFQSKSEAINLDSSVPEIIFWHVPSKAFSSVAPSVSTLGTCVGLMNNEKVASQEYEFGMMKALESRPSVKAVIVGHNHGLDWCCPSKNLWLCFARHTGYGGYGSWDRGSRILEISQQPFFIKSWIRMEDGSVHGEVFLSH